MVWTERFVTSLGGQLWWPPLLPIRGGRAAVFTRMWGLGCANSLRPPNLLGSCVLGRFLAPVWFPRGDRVRGAHDGVISLGSVGPRHHSHSGLRFFLNDAFPPDSILLWLERDCRDASPPLPSAQPPFPLQLFICGVSYSK